MKAYRFVGTDSEITGYPRLQRFGQRIELPDDFNVSSGHGIPLLPEKVFESVGFTVEELQRFADPGSHAEAPQEFLDKKLKAIGLLHKGD